MKKISIINQIKENGLVAVLRSKDDNEICEVSREVIKGGIKTLELTFTTPYVENAIEILSKEYKEYDDVIIGAGTVLDEVTARIAIMKGAKFIVSPCLVESVAKVCNLYQIPYLPGCGSLTEITKGLELGCDVIKLFPGNLFGPEFIKDVRGPLPYAELMPSGGVNYDNMDKWLEYGAFALSIGSALTKDKNKICETSKKYIDKFNSLRK